MPAERTLTPVETRSLLAERPPSYHSTDDVSTPPQATNKYAPGHVRWILVGLWSAVLLGAFDGAFPIPARRSYSPNHRRHRRRHPADAHRERVQRLEPGVLHRHGVPPLRVLLHPAVRSVVPPFAPTRSHSPPPGRLADILGRRGAMLLALTLFGEPRPK